ncbi:MAG: ferredoxin [Planctomycetota bacterium]
MSRLETEELAARDRAGGTAWSLVQAFVWAAGLGIVMALLWAPDIGLHAFWNFLIPVAPAVFVLIPGIWRNVCPLAFTSLLLENLGVPARRRMSAHANERLLLIGIVLLFLIVPFRHVMLDLNGPATALVLILLAAVAVTMGSVFESKSGWCSGICPVHPVEKLYGSKPWTSAQNLHCERCERCVPVCPDSTPELSMMTGANKSSRRGLGGVLMLGGFSGFIWGWFQVPDYRGLDGWAHLTSAYGYPFLGALCTLLLYLILRRLLEHRHHGFLGLAFAAAAVGCYYWYRLPALFGFGPYPGDGMLLDLRHALPAWCPAASRLATTFFLVWWLLMRNGARRSWSERPEFA